MDSPPGSSVHGISQAKYWIGLPFHTPGDLPSPGIEPTSLVSCIGSCILYPQSHLGSMCVCVCVCVCDWIWLKLLLTLSTDRNSTLRILELPFKMEYKELRILISWFLFMEIDTEKEEQFDQGQQVNQGHSKDLSLSFKGLKLCTQYWLLFTSGYCTGQKKKRQLSKLAISRYKWFHITV